MQTEEMYFLLAIYKPAHFGTQYPDTLMCSKPGFDLKIQACRKSTVIIWSEKDEATLFKTIQKEKKTHIRRQKMEAKSISEEQPKT